MWDAAPAPSPGRPPRGRDSRANQPSSWRQADTSASTGAWGASESAAPAWGNESTTSSSQLAGGWGEQLSTSAQTADSAPNWGKPAKTSSPAADGAWQEQRGKPQSARNEQQQPSGGWDNVKPAKNDNNGGWGAPAPAAAPTTASNASWGAPANNTSSWGQKSPAQQPKKQEFAWGASDSGWNTTTDTTAAASTATDAWGDPNAQKSTEWNPDAVSWLKKDSDAGSKKQGETGRGEWQDGKHILAEPNEELEIKLFGTKDDIESMHTGIKFDQYKNIPVTVENDIQIDTMDEFTSPPLNEHLLSNIKLARYTTPTPVQKYAVPLVMGGRDVMACAQTGSGKTAGFLFPVLSLLFNDGPQVDRRTLTSQKAHPLCLILAPTRELVLQIYNEARKFAYRSYVRPCVAYGGAEINPQLRMLGRGCQLLVATPGRLVDIIERRRLSLAQIKYLVIDEADRMLDMGFEPQIRRIVEGEDMPGVSERQTLMFSATFPTAIQRLARDFLKEYVFFTVGRVGGTSENITQRIIRVPEDKKDKMLVETLDEMEDKGGLTLVFVETKRMADYVCFFLKSKNFKATSIHGDRQQFEREEALQSFRTGATPIMVATAVAARGLDIPNVNHVISFDMPKEIDDYIHRIGRTARAGNTGYATGFFNDNNNWLARDLVALLKEAKQDVPDWLQAIADELGQQTPPEFKPPRRRRKISI
ncbi:P-loop containing nucleoside triphosphate hydrolase protein [Gongronella butleri]|nr:P-loop containing nucleoside triphosphate hydrolase protein [Gongronella butleri]